MYELNSLSPAQGAKKNRKRKARGPGSGLGKTAGRGAKGQKSRSGGKIRPGFEGGQMPLARRLPKRGFYNRFSKEVAIVNVSMLNRFSDGDRVDAAALLESGLIRGKFDLVKVLGVGELERSLTVVVDKVSKSAQAKIEAAGGSVEVTGG